MNPVLCQAPGHSAPKSPVFDPQSWRCDPQSWRCDVAKHLLHSPSSLLYCIVLYCTMLPFIRRMAVSNKTYTHTNRHGVMQNTQKTGNSILQCVFFLHHRASQGFVDQRPQSRVIAPILHNDIGNPLTIRPMRAPVNLRDMLCPVIGATPCHDGVQFPLLQCTVVATEHPGLQGDVDDLPLCVTDTRIGQLVTMGCVGQPQHQVAPGRVVDAYPLPVKVLVPLIGADTEIVIATVLEVRLVVHTLSVYEPAREAHGHRWEQLGGNQIIADTFSLTLG